MPDLTLEARQRIDSYLLEAITCKRQVLKCKEAAKMMKTPCTTSPGCFVPFSERPIVTVGDGKYNVCTLCDRVPKLAGSPPLRICSNCKRGYLCPYWSSSYVVYQYLNTYFPLVWGTPWFERHVAGFFLSNRFLSCDCWKCFLILVVHDCELLLGQYHWYFKKYRSIS